GQPLIVDAERCPRAGPQALFGDRVAAALADAVRALVETRERTVDLRERLLGAFLESLVELTVEGDRRHVAEMVVGAAAGQLAELGLEVARTVLVEVGD